MALRPENIENTEFSTSLRGFDKDEVKNFLKRVAASSRELETRLAASERELEERRAVPSFGEPMGAQPVPAAPPVDATFLTEPPSEPTDEVEALEMAIADRYGALGDRIADLLRSADESAGELRESARAEVAALKADAESEASAMLAEARTIRAEADAYRLETEAAVESIRAQAVADGTASLDAREAAVSAVEQAADQDRNQARAELEDVRAQVTGLLEQARAQSEFIKQEAEEIIRTKVRANLSAAQERLDVLRNTEVSSRERILMAQRELDNALSRLDAEPMPVLDPSNDREILEEAERRALSHDPSMDTQPSGPPTFPGHAATEGVTPSTLTPSFHEEYIEASIVDDDRVTEAAEAEAHIEAEVDMEATNVDGAEAPPVDQLTWAQPATPIDVEPVAETVAADPIAAETDAGFEHQSYEPVAEPAPRPPADMFGVSSGVVAAPPEVVSNAVDESVAAESGESDPRDLAADIAEAQENPFYSGLASDEAVDQSFMEEPVIGGPEEEDALARLVREAMQEAVDSARKSE